MAEDVIKPIIQTIEERKKELTEKMEKQMLKRLQSSTYPMRELLAFYKCAMMEVETKFKVLDEQFSLSHDRNPIESISTRLKSLDHIYEKARRKGIPLNTDAIEKGIFDIAGVRVVCPFEKDIYMLRSSILSHDDITLIEERDYIKNPKPSGYRSLHLIVEVPIFLREEKRLMKVEVQLRTMAMDQWASLEHRLMYKKDLPDDVRNEMKKKLLECAELNRRLDEIMQDVKDTTDLYQEEEEQDPPSPFRRFLQS
ncbi:MAG: GTP pyrophosphokinase family protein [Candidatus Ornithospirochaeta sp.]